MPLPENVNPPMPPCAFGSATADAPDPSPVITAASVPDVAYPVPGEVTVIDVINPAAVLREYGLISVIVAADDVVSTSVSA